MIKKSIFVVLAVFGFSAFADMHGVDQMADMMSDSSGEDSGFAGSFWLKYKALDAVGPDADALSYRARASWSGDVNEDVQWGLGLSTRLEQQFTAPSLADIALEQAYVSYAPVDGLSITAGKKGWSVDFHKVGVLYDERLYSEGVTAKYRQEMDESSFYVKAGLINLNTTDDSDWGVKDWSGTFAEGSLVVAKVGGKAALTDDISAGVYVSGEYDGLLKTDMAVMEESTAEEGEAEDAEEASQPAVSSDPKTLAKAGITISSPSIMPVPVGLYGVYVTDTADIGANHSWTAGVYVGSAGSVAPGSAGNFGLSASYYTLSEGDLNTALLHRDYVSGAGTGIAARAQYNPWDNTNLVVKYAYGLDSEDGGNGGLVGELTFHF